MPHPRAASSPACCRPISYSATGRCPRAGWLPVRRTWREHPSLEVAGNRTHSETRTKLTEDQTMHALTATLGLAMLALIGLATVLALVILVLYEVRVITRLSGRIAISDEHAPRFFEDVAPHR